jgi:hypothetical protein
MLIHSASLVLRTKHPAKRKKIQENGYLQVLGKLCVLRWLKNTNFHDKSMGAIVKQPDPGISIN